MQNTYKHISDKSLFVTFDPTGSGFPESVENVQDALSKIGPWALTDNGLPKASETTEGVIRLSTQQEVNDGISDNTAVTPKTLAKRLNHPEATETSLGLTQYATNDEALSGLLNNRSIVTSSLDYVLNTRTSTESKTGTIKISTGLQAESGEDDTTAMTPKKVKQAINKLSPSIGIATETNTGTVTLATAGIAQTGIAHDGVAISPKIFVSARATDTKVGTTRFATLNEAKNSINSNTLAVSVKLFESINASTERYGTTKLVLNKGEDGALSGKANVVSLSGDNMTGRLKLNGVDYITRGEAGVPIGGYQIFAYDRDSYENGQYFKANGRALNKNDYPELFERLGYTYGGAGNIFNIPNANDRFLRATSPSRPVGRYEEDALQEHTHIAGTETAYHDNVPTTRTRNTPGGEDLRWYDDRTGPVNYKSHNVRVSSETRPKNLSAVFAIRVK